MTTQRRAVIGIVVIAALLFALVVGVSPGGQSSHSQAPGPFAWLRPIPTPAGWKVTRITGGATLSYPPGWKPIKTDPGTATVALLGDGDRIVGYLNATPRQGTETLANWTSFRPDHNRDEGDRAVHPIASATGLSFPAARGSCVIDDYTTSRATYREIACLVSGSRSSAVIVAAAPNTSWNAEVATLHRAVSAFAP